MHKQFIHRILKSILALGMMLFGHFGANVSAQTSTFDRFAMCFDDVPLHKPMDVHHVLPVLSYHDIPDSVLFAVVPPSRINSLPYATQSGWEGTIRFRMSDQVDAFLVRSYNADRFLFTESHLLILLNHRAHEFVDVITLDVNYQEEGIYGQIRSFLHDVNTDGTMELMGVNFNLYNPDQRLVWYWEMVGSQVTKHTLPIDSLYTFTKDSGSIDGLTMDEMVACVKHHFQSSSTINEWSILLATGTSLTDIQHLKDHYDSLAIYSPQYAYYLGVWDCLMYQKGAEYYLILNEGITLTQARLSLPEVEKRFTKDAKVFKLSRICSDWKPGDGAVDYRCSD
ncbi:MAG: hypothetical protein KDC76_01465 [Bacteroidetes bacterium]|nr:hypothetical protein [Bacteroidota bacterium]